MQSLYFDIILLLYGSVAVVSVVAYVPQIYNLIISTGRSEAVSISSWLLWLFTSGISLLYGLAIIKVLPFIVVSAINFTGVAMILLLTIYNRYFRFNETLPKGMSIKNFKKLEKKLLVEND